MVELARHAPHRRLGDTLYQQVFCALNASPGARAFYNRHRDREPPTTKPYGPSGTLVGILHGCLRHHTTYDESTAWPALDNQDQQAA